MLKLNNNNISDITELPEMLRVKFVDPETLAILDLSFNNIGKIDSVRKLFFSCYFVG